MWEMTRKSEREMQDGLFKFQTSARLQACQRGPTCQNRLQRGVKSLRSHFLRDMTCWLSWCNLGTPYYSFLHKSSACQGAESGYRVKHSWRVGKGPESGSPFL